MKTKFFITIGALFLSGLALGQKGTVKGTVYEMMDGKKVPVPFANVIELGTTNGVATDINGNYNFDLTTGNKKVIFSAIGYHVDTISVQIKAGETVALNNEVKTKAIVLDGGVEIVAKQDKEKDEMQLTERKEAEGIQTNISKEAMTKAGASDVATGITKVAGLSVVGSKYVFVRGMGDRYNAAYLNGMPIASPDPDNKVIPMNIFPTSVVRSLSVNKAFTPNLYGDFAGGAINIQTKDYPDEPTLMVNLGTGMNTQSTFKDFRTYNGGKSDYWGIDDGTRDMPNDIAAADDYNSSDAEGANSKFAQNMNAVTKKAPVNTSFSIYGGNYYQLGNNKEESQMGIGVLGLVSHNASSYYQNGKIRTLNLQNVAQLDYDFETYGFATRSSALANILFDLNDRHSITYNMLYVNLSSDETRDTWGSHFDYNRNLFSRRYTYRENNLMVHQLLGKHSLLSNNRLTVNWGAVRSIANSKEPDRRQLVYLYNEDAATDYSFNHVDRLDNHRFFSALEEYEWAFKAEATYALKFKEEDEETARPQSIWNVTLGYNMRLKERLFDYRQFVYVLNGFNNVNLYQGGPIDINNPDGALNDENLAAGVYEIDEALNPASSYWADQDITAYYLGTDAYITPKLHVTVGARYEDGYQPIVFKDQTQPRFTIKQIVLSQDVLPSLSMKYEVKENNFIRLSGSKTISRPGFKEIAPFEYTEVFAGMKSRGNPFLINGSNYNTDIRYEVYPNAGELLSVTGFYKYLQNPIERTMLATASGQLQSFQNANEATVMGVELEAIKNLSFLASNDSSYLKNFSVGINASFLNSQVNLLDTGAVSNIVTNTERPLQGASPYLVNFDLSYEKYDLEHDVKYTATVSYNVFGKRLSNVGIQGLGDVYELPVNTVNLVVGARFKRRFNVQVSATNLLNPLVLLEQEANPENIEVNSYKRGTSVGISLSYNLLNPNKNRTE